MEKEILACIEDENIKFLQSGQISKHVFPMERKRAHSNKISHLIVRVFIVAIKPGNQMIYLVQKRAKEKESFPNYFTDSASGHVLYDKNLNLNIIKENAIRELNEEFGIESSAVKNLTFYDLDVEQNNLTTEVAFIFFGLIDYDVSLNPDPKEVVVEESKFYTRKELENILDNEKSVDYSKKIWKNILETDMKAYFDKKKDLSKKETNGIALYIGRFQPLHHGHIYVIYRIMERHEMIKIGIGSSQFSHTVNDPFSAEERRQFIIAALKKRNITNYEIYDIPDIFNAKKWVDHVKSIVGDFDIVYSNSEWVRELFQNKGYSLGKKMTIFKKKYNASNIRESINENKESWRNLMPNEVISTIKDFNGIERIQSLYEKK
ncbi:MAG: nicotinamide-nucleotide adenylyltransferase [Promethearchaeota archaeon]|nr:MAG: nicotinamide-nucleotide adenylyltransferase [Candidatus Lokiarchaeota archaeon]